MTENPETQSENMGNNEIMSEETVSWNTIIITSRAMANRSRPESIGSSLYCPSQKW